MCILQSRLYQKQTNCFNFITHNFEFDYCHFIKSNLEFVKKLFEPQTHTKNINEKY